MQSQILSGGIDEDVRCHCQRIMASIVLKKQRLHATTRNLQACLCCGLQQIAMQIAHTRRLFMAVTA